MSQAIHDTHSANNTIEAVTQQFDYWRTSREKRGPIPERLWALAVSLATQYGFSRIVKELKLCSSTFRHRLSSAVMVKIKQANSVQLIECQNPMLPKPMQPFAQSRSVEFTCKNSSLVKLTGLSISDIQLVITQLMGDT